MSIQLSPPLVKTPGSATGALLVWAAALSFLSGATCAGWTPRQKAPAFELERAYDRRGSEPSITVRPSYHVPEAPAICSLQQTEKGPRVLAVIYTKSASGALHIERPLDTYDAQPTLLIVAPRLPSCYALAWLDRLSGDQGIFFRSLLHLWSAQSFRIASSGPSPSLSVLAHGTDPSAVR